MAHPLPFVQVLLFRDNERSRLLGPALWAALQEVENFYNLDTPRATYARHYLADFIPEAIRPSLSEGWEERAAAVEDERAWNSMRGHYTNTYDQVKLVQWVKKLIAPTPRHARIVIVVDQEIIPPPHWRYIIWDRVDDGIVVSATAVDPLFWNSPHEHRGASVKHRVRVACLSSAGARLGIKKCDNPECFRRKPVQSVLDLDVMLYLGAEHDLPALAGRGFDPYPHDPARVQPVIIVDSRSGESVS